MRNSTAANNAASSPPVPARTSRIEFRSSASSFGNSITLIALNAEFTYWVPLRKDPWNVYLGGGPAANIFTSGPVGGRSTDVRPGFNFLAGIAQRSGLFSEIKIGAIDSPSFKFGIGYTFR